MSTDLLTPASILAESHASARGFHYWRQFHGCPYRRVLDERAKLRVLEGDDEPAFVAAATPGKVNMRNVGVLFHKLCELYYTDQLTKVTWEYAGDDDPIDWKEATRIFRAYRDKFPVGEFGALFAAEWGFRFGSDEPWDFEKHFAELDKLRAPLKGLRCGCGGLDTEPEPGPCPYHTAFEKRYKERDGDWPREACFEEFGVPEYGGRIDLLPMVLEDNLSLLRELRPNAPILYPGVYILDHKVRGRDTTYLREQYLDSIQMQLYMHAWDLLHPEQPCQGAIISLAIPRPPIKSDPNRLPEFRSYLIPKPSPESTSQARHYMRTAYDLRESHGTARANREECWRYEYNPCPHHPLVGGGCNLKGE